MVSARFYNLLYRIGAPWGGAPRPELVRLIHDGQVTSATHPRALDIGCGAGADSVFLAQQGFHVTGVDFSSHALALARHEVRSHGVEDRVHLVEADLSGPELPGVQGPFDLLFDGGSIDDLQDEARRTAARHVVRLSRPGAVLLMWCFYGDRSELPWVSFTGPSRLAPGIEPGEPETLFGSHFSIQRLDRAPHAGRWAVFRMDRR